MRENPEVLKKENSFVCTPGIKKQLERQIRIMNEEDGLKDKGEDTKYKLKHFKNIHVTQKKCG